MLSISKLATGSVIRTGARVRVGRTLNGIEAAGPELLQSLPLEAKTNGADGADGSLVEWGLGAGATLPRLGDKAWTVTLFRPQ